MYITKCAITAILHFCKTTLLVAGFRCYLCVHYSEVSVQFALLRLFLVCLCVLTVFSILYMYLSCFVMIFTHFCSQQLCFHRFRLCNTSKLFSVD